MSCFVSLSHLPVLGTGAFSKVYLYQADETAIAIKCATLAEHHLSLIREYQILRYLGFHCNLTEVNICALQHHQFCYGTEQPYEMGMALVAYKDSLYRTSFLSLPLMQSITRQLATALNHLQVYDIVHADIKPANILFNGAKIALADFGLARFVSRAYRSEEQEEQTLEYRAPEVALASVVHEAVYPLSFAMDWWSLGATLAELYTKQILFPLTDEESDIYHLISRHEEVLGTAYPQELISTSDEHIGQLIYQQKISCKHSARRCRTVLTTRALMQKEATNPLSLQFHDLISHLLAFLPYQRITPTQVQSHPFVSSRDVLLTEAVERKTCGIAKELFFAEEELSEDLYPTQEEVDAWDTTLSLRGAQEKIQQWELATLFTQKTLASGSFATIARTAFGAELLKCDGFFLRYSHSSSFVMQEAKLLCMHPLKASCHLPFRVMLYDPGMIPLSLCRPEIIKDKFSAIFSKLLSAVEDLQRLQLLHNRISPTAVFINEADEIKLGEFCHACFVTQEHARARFWSHSNHHLIASHYSSPEFRRNDELSLSSDIYSLGRLLYRYGPKETEHYAAQMTRQSSTKRPTLDVIRLWEI